MSLHHRSIAGATGIATAFLLSACLLDRDTSDKRPPIVSDGDYTPIEPTSPPGWPSIQWPPENPYSPEKAILGRRLFFDPVLSLTFDRACAWCHAPNVAFADPRGNAFSVGVGTGVTTRNSPTLANLAFAQSFMWDGRFPSLEAQALGPLFAHNEMNMTEAEIVSRLSDDTSYVSLFRQAYGEGPVSLDGVAKALATYQRTLVSHRSAYDRWSAGDSNALSPAAKRGMGLFTGTKAGCASCHTPPLFTDGGFYNIGLDALTGDAGRGGFTGVSADAGKFKVPTVRNIHYSDPYMHDGRFRRLEEVVAHYNSGGEPHPGRDTRIRPLGLTADEISDLIEFLDALSDSSFLATSHFDPELK